MARNGSGTFTLVAGNPVVTGTTISSTVQNSTMNDIAAALTASIAADGQTPITADIPFNGHKITGLAAGTNPGDAVRFEQIKAPTVQVFNASGVYTPSAGVIKALIYTKGAGGSGGGSTLSTSNGGGGGEGEEAWLLATAAEIGASQVVTVGPAGAFISANTNSAGNSGGSTSFGTLVTAAGGSGGAAGGTATGGSGGIGGTGADWSQPGANGSAGSDEGLTIPLKASGGGKGGGVNSGADAVGIVGGGGGGGGVSFRSGAGARGICVVMEYYS